MVLRKDSSLWEKQEIGKDDDLEGYVTAGEFAGMINDIFLDGAESVDATEFGETFDEWFCVELKDLLIDYGIDLDAPVDVDAMVRMAESEEQQER